ncbi:Hypothetical protein A7982_09766 [Minicystis rosea]|nr:Hypothetical protein A7982_09766 [Minicystis rosea]
MTLGDRARVTAFAVAVVTATVPARAADRAGALDAPAPPTLPALSHPSLSNTFEISMASIDPGRGGARAFAFVLHDEIEYPLVSRVWYVGAAHAVAAGAVPGVGHDFFVGAPELWTRGLWSSLMGLSSGGGIGVVLPLPRSLSPSAAEVFDNVRVVRPWDAPYFADMAITLRPWIDVRHVVGQFILQVRQGMDISILTRSLKPDQHRTDYTARTTFYVGFRIARPIGVGLEVWEVYQLTADVPDERRSAFAISPSVRLSLGKIEPALSLVIPISTPLRGENASYVAARLSVGFDFDAGRHENR